MVGMVLIRCGSTDQFKVLLLLHQSHFIAHLLSDPGSSRLRSCKTGMDKKLQVKALNIVNNPNNPEQNM